MLAAQNMTASLAPKSWEVNGSTPTYQTPMTTSQAIMLFTAQSKHRNHINIPPSYSRAMRLVLLLIVMLALASAQAIDDPKLVKSISLTIDEGGRVTANTKLYEVNITLTLPQESTYLTAEYSVDTVTDGQGNVLANIFRENPPNPFSYVVSAQLESRERTLSSLPQEYELLPEHMKYTLPTEHANSGSPKLKAFAEAITANSSTGFERVAKLAIWTHNYIEYDISLVGQKKDSDWVLQNKKGVCIEYASLFNALARSIGIPSRYVLGVSYGERGYGWLGHAWSEVFLGEWMPVDPTWLEVGQLDATHLAYYRSDDVDSTSTVRVKGAQGIESPVWDRPDFGGGRDSNLNVTVHSVESNEEVTTSPLLYGTKKLSFGGSTIVFLPIEAPDYRVVDLTMVDCSGSIDVLEFDGSEQDLILEPQTQRVAAWVIKAKALDPHSVYTCPITLNSGFLEEESINIEVQKGSSPPSFTAELKQGTVNLGETQTVYVNTASSGFRIGFVSAEDYGSKDAAATRQSFTFTPESLGPQKVYVYTTEGGVKELGFDVVHNADIFIQNVLVDASVPLGQQVNVAVVIANNRDQPEDVDVRLSFGDDAYVKRVSVNGTETVHAVFTAGSVGEQNLVVRASAAGVSDEDIVPIGVYEPPVVSMREPELEYSGTQVVARLAFDIPPGAVNTTLEFDGDTIAVGPEVINITLEQGSYPMTLRWMDSAGNPYAKKLTLNIPAEPEKPVLESASADILILVAVGGAAVLGLLFLFVALIFFLVPRKSGL